MEKGEGKVVGGGGAGDEGKEEGRLRKGSISCM